MKAAPTPWVANRLHVDDANKEHVLTVDTGAHNALDASIAAEVVRRVNSFDALVEALEAAQNGLRWYRDEAARAREEQREECARALDPETTLKGEWFVARVRATPLSCGRTPLADEIRVLKATLDGQRDELARLRAEVKRLRTAARHLIDSLDIENPGPAQRELMAALKPLKKGTR